jgi:hypothetical protein
MCKGTIRYDNGYINSRKSIRSKYNNLKIILGVFYTISWLGKLRVYVIFLREKFYDGIETEFVDKTMRLFYNNKTN